MCQPFGTNVTAACRLPHAKAITDQIVEIFNKAKCRQTRGAGGGSWGAKSRCTKAKKQAAVPLFLPAPPSLRRKPRLQLKLHSLLVRLLTLAAHSWAVLLAAADRPWPWLLPTGRPLVASR
jgi:hypothetical protein